MPLLNTLGMKFGSEEVFGAGYNVLPIWKERLDPKTLVTTPNSDVIYAMSYVDMGETGPIVFEAPPNLQGILLDFWQRPIPVDGGRFAGDVGLPGPDAGKGGKFLVLPPAYQGDVPAGYYVYRSGTNNVFIFLRAFYQDPADLAPAVELMEQSKVYPLDLPESERKPMEFPNASGVPANMLPRSDATAFEHLKWLLDREGENLAGPDGLGLLANVGLIAGQPFEPDAKTRAILDAAAKTAYKTSRVIGLSDEVGGRSLRVWPDRQWVNPINNATEPGPEKSLDLAWRNKAAGFTEIEARAWFFTNYYSISPGMVSLTPGRGAAYEVAFNDADGEPLSGDASYQLTLPADIPAELFWSLTLYEAENAQGWRRKRAASPRSARATTPCRTPTARPTCTSAPRRRRGRRRTGCPRRRAAASFPFSGSTAPARKPSTTAGSQAISRRYNSNADAGPGHAERRHAPAARESPSGGVSDVPVRTQGELPTPNAARPDTGRAMLEMFFDHRGARLNGPKAADAKAALKLASATRADTWSSWKTACSSTPRICRPRMPTRR
jgi:hypothetical protein